MNIYRIEKNRERRNGRYAGPVKSSGLKIAAGGEDIVTLSTEAIDSFTRDSSARSREEELKRLVLMHINDKSPLLEGLENDREFIAAERLSLLAELVIRVAPSVKGGNIYERAGDFVIDQLTGK